MFANLSNFMARASGIRVRSGSRDLKVAQSDPAFEPYAQPAIHLHYIPARLRDLNVVANIGKGSFGSVKLVHHKVTGQMFALKRQDKRNILKFGIQQAVVEERRLLMTLDHPSILRLHDSFQDEGFVYFVLELVVGGELSAHLMQAGRFSELSARFYAASIVDILSYLHERRVAYRDLKPENLLLDGRGFLKLVDFGLAKVVQKGLTWTQCGTPDYLAPEVILNEGHDHAVDYWALGILIYQMVAGVPPFHAEELSVIEDNILARKLEFPDFFSNDAQDIIQKLLKVNKKKRLGNRHGGCAAIATQKWFTGFDWEGLSKREIAPPIEPMMFTDRFSKRIDFAQRGDLCQTLCPEWSPDF